MDPVVHFEMPFKDRDRMVDFYEKAFGWRAQRYGEEMGNYVTVETSETGADGRPAQSGSINGGFFELRPENADAGPGLVIAVDDAGAAAERVRRSGGTVLAEPTEIPGVGLYVPFVDPEGNRVSLLQPVMPD